MVEGLTQHLSHPRSRHVQDGIRETYTLNQTYRIPGPGVSKGDLFVHAAGGRPEEVSFKLRYGKQLGDFLVDTDTGGMLLVPTLLGNHTAHLVAVEPFALLLALFFAALVKAPVLAPVAHNEAPQAAFAAFAAFAVAPAPSPRWPSRPASFLARPLAFEEGGWVVGDLLKGLVRGQKPCSGLFPVPQKGLVHRRLGSWSIGSKGGIYYEIMGKGGTKIPHSPPKVAPSIK